MDPKPKYLLYVLPFVTGALGLWMAVMTVHRYEMVVKGMLGLAVCYYTYEVFISPRNVLAKQPLESLLLFPKNIRFSLLTFIVTLTWYWALRQFLDMVFFLFR